MNTIHGDYSVTVSEKIITVILKGAFNEIGFQSFILQVREAVEAFSGNPFYILIDASELIGATPDAFSELESVNQWINTQNMQAKALVINSIVNSNTIQKSTPALKKQNLQHFDTRESALQWLKTI